MPSIRRSRPHANFQAIVEKLVKKYGNQTKAAAAIGIDNSDFTRAKEKGTFSVEACLKVADSLGMRAATIFRVAQKGETADLIERLSPRIDNSFTREEREVVKVWRQLDPDMQRIVMSIMQRDVAVASAKAARSGSGGQKPEVKEETRAQQEDEP